VALAETVAAEEVAVEALATEAAEVRASILALKRSIPNDTTGGSRGGFGDRGGRGGGRGGFGDRGGRGGTLSSLDSAGLYADSIQQVAVDVVVTGAAVVDAVVPWVPRVVRRPLS
jgi:hypothetical protein